MFFSCPHLFSKLNQVTMATCGGFSPLTHPTACCDHFPGGPSCQARPKHRRHPRFPGPRRSPVASWGVLGGSLRCTAKVISKKGFIILTSAHGCTYTYGFLSHRATPSHPFLDGMFQYKTAILGYPYRFPNLVAVHIVESVGFRFG